MEIRHPNDLTWEWTDSNRGYSVRVFPSTKRLIWSSWAGTDEGTVFDDGVAQTIESFLAGHPAPLPTPPEVLEALRQYVRSLK